MNNTGTIQGVDHTPGSGIATLVLLDDDGNIVRVHSDAGPLFRSLDRAFAEPHRPIGTGCSLSVGNRIYYETDDLGVITDFDVVPQLDIDRLQEDAEGRFSEDRNDAIESCEREGEAYFEEA